MREEGGAYLFCERIGRRVRNGDGRGWLAEGDAANENDCFDAYEVLYERCVEEM
jgi:hypothetical protein